MNTKDTKTLRLWLPKTEDDYSAQMRRQLWQTLDIILADKRMRKPMDEELTPAEIQAAYDAAILLPIMHANRLTGPALKQYSKNVSEQILTMSLKRMTELFPKYPPVLDRIGNKRRLDMSFADQTLEKLFVSINLRRAVSYQRGDITFCYQYVNEFYPNFDQKLYEEWMMIMCVNWHDALMGELSRQFPHVFKKIDDEFPKNVTEQDSYDVKSLINWENSMVRLLSGGDVTKIEQVYRTNIYYALEEVEYRLAHSNKEE